jgi:hypothetical protein
MIRIQGYAPSPGAARHPLLQGERAEMYRKIALSLWERGDPDESGWVRVRSPPALSPNFVILKEWPSS